MRLHIARTLQTSLASWLIQLPAWWKRLIVLGSDASIVAAAVALAWLLSSPEWSPQRGLLAPLLAVAIVCFLSSFALNRVYIAVFRHVSQADGAALVRAVAAGAFPFAAVASWLSGRQLPASILVVVPILILLLASASRASVRSMLATPTAKGLAARRQRAFIYGAGASGAQLLQTLRGNSAFDIQGFFDDDPGLIGRNIDGKKVFDRTQLESLCAARETSLVLLAMPSVSRRRRREIVAELKSVHIDVKTVPALDDIVSGRISLGDLREVDVTDLLGRDPVIPSPNLLRRTVDGKVVMVTGAGGSIGSELCRQLLRCKPRGLVLVDHSEFALYSILEELRHDSASEVALVPVLASVRDRHCMEDVFRMHCPSTVYHAAAYKHVPLVEENVCKAVENNALGTFEIARLARDHAVESFTLISTDKAVRPTSVMGATKRLSELVLQAFAAEGGATKFSMVRFGNVLGSSGSVVPRFKEQIRAGGPVTITHPDITRFFMTISEAAQLVLQASSMANGGDVFLLDMGAPVKIVDLARGMVRLSGLHIRDSDTPDGDIEIVTTGLRPGEKLYEELLIDAEAMPTDHPKIFRAIEPFISADELAIEMAVFRALVRHSDDSGVRVRLARLVPGFRANVTELRPGGRRLTAVPAETGSSPTIANAVG